MRKLVLISAALGAMTLASGANATTYLLNQDHCSTPCIAAGTTSDGTIDVTSIAGGLHVAVTLATNIYFNQAGAGHDAFALLLSGNPTVTFQNSRTPTPAARWSTAPTTSG